MTKRTTIEKKLFKYKQTDTTDYIYSDIKKNYQTKPEIVTERCIELEVGVEELLLLMDIADVDDDAVVVRCDDDDDDEDDDTTTAAAAAAAAAAAIELDIEKLPLLLPPFPCADE